MGIAHALPRTFSSIVETTFADTTVDFDASGTQFYAFEPDISGVGQETFENLNNRPTAFNEFENVRGLKSASTFTWAEYLTASGVTAAASSQAASTVLSDHLLAALGGRSLNYRTIAVSNIAADVTVTTSEGANFVVGDMVYINDSTSGGDWFRVEAIAGDVLTLDRTPGFTVSNNTLLAGIQNYCDWFVATTPSESQHKTLAMAIKGVDTQDYWELYGVKPQVEIDELQQNTAPTLRFNGLATKFEWETLTPAALAGTNEGEAPLANSTGCSFKFKIAQVGSDLADVDAYKLQPRFGITYSGVDGPNGCEGRHAFIGSGFDPGLDVTLEFNSVYGDAFRRKTLYHALITIGDGDDSVSIYYPYLEIASEPKRSGEDNVSVDVSFRALRNQVADGASLAGADLRRWYAPFHITMTA
jgi:hypothetical protein